MSVSVLLSQTVTLCRSYIREHEIDTKLVIEIKNCHHDHYIYDYYNNTVLLIHFKSIIITSKNSK